MAEVYAQHTSKAYGLDRIINFHSRALKPRELLLEKFFGELVASPMSETASPGTIEVISKRLPEQNDAISSHRSMALKREEIKSADIVLTMTASHKDNILIYAQDIPDLEKKVFTLKEYANSVSHYSDSADIDVVDPYGAGAIPNLTSLLLSKTDIEMQKLGRNYLKKIKGYFESKAKKIREKKGNRGISFRTNEWIARRGFSFCVYSETLENVTLSQIRNLRSRPSHFVKSPFEISIEIDSERKKAYTETFDEIKEAIDHISPSAAPYSSIGLPYIMRPRANEDRQIVKMWLAVIENLLPQYTSDAAEDNEVNNMLLKLTNSSLDNLLGRGRTEILKKIKGEE
ncbi:hypothetical protein QT06_C0001G1114 [archaeon GW2011_AR15]|nr:hypothetical protein QT06_C0001G1114 [archaeon GW2011_AR15]